MKRFANRNALITPAGDFMGPAVCELFAEEGAAVTADESDLTRPQAADDLRYAAQAVSIFWLSTSWNAIDAMRLSTPGDAEWAAMFDAMVHPLHRLVRAVLPQMLEHRTLPAKSW